MDAIAPDAPLSKAAFTRAADDLRTRLLAAQQALRGSGVPVVVLVAGVDGAGKGEVVNRLNQWLDTRGMDVHAFWDETDDERQRPRAWRYWRALPAKGRIAVLFGGWYDEPVAHCYAGHCDTADLAEPLTDIGCFERMLAADGVLLVKFWYRLDAEQQRVRLKALRRDSHSRWKMLPRKGNGKVHYAEYFRLFEKLSDQLVAHTDLPDAPWHVIDAADPRQRDLATGQALLEAVETRLQGATEPVRAAAAPVVADDSLARIDGLDLSQRLSRLQYHKALKQLRRDLNELTWEAYRRQRPTLLVFEGMDAAGKGGTIRRIAETVDARLRQVIPVAAPSDEEAAHHYLWRFWRHVPRAGRMAIFDRSWYGRVLVERVEDLTAPDRWQAAYGEIRDFEKQLVDSGAVLLKFWLQISRDEQLTRFREREQVPYKRYKITPEDWRNRERWADYRLAIGDMLAQTDVPRAPWHLVAADDKPHARIDVMTRLRDALAEAL